MCRVKSEFSFALLIFIVITEVWIADGRPLADDVANVAETLRMLERLDNYYSKLARPRFGRSINDKLTLAELSRRSMTDGLSPFHDELY